MIKKIMVLLVAALIIGGGISYAVTTPVTFEIDLRTLSESDLLRFEFSLTNLSLQNKRVSLEIKNTKTGQISSYNFPAYVSSKFMTVSSANVEESDPIQVRVKGDVFTDKSGNVIDPDFSQAIPVIKNGRCLKTLYLGDVSYVPASTDPMDVKASYFKYNQKIKPMYFIPILTQ